jgi:hypothetical protein
MVKKISKNGSKKSNSNHFSAYKEACDYLQEMWNTGHSLRSLVYQPRTTSKKQPSDSNNTTTATTINKDIELVCSKRTFAILSNLVKVQEPLQDILNESILQISPNTTKFKKKRSSKNGDDPSSPEPVVVTTPNVTNTALMLIMAYELLLSKQQKIAGGGAIKRLLLSHEETLRAKIQANETLRTELQRTMMAAANSGGDGGKTHANHHADPNGSTTTSKPYHFRLLVHAETAMKNESAREILQHHHCTADDLLPNVYQTTLPKARIVAHSDFFLIQSQASCLPAYCLYQSLVLLGNNQQEQSHVILDACAAPGNKTLQLASYFFGENDSSSSSSIIVALDKDVHRYEILKRRCAAACSNHIQTFHQDFLTYTNPLVTPILLFGRA